MPKTMSVSVEYTPGQVQKQINNLKLVQKKHKARKDKLDNEIKKLEDLLK